MGGMVQGGVAERGMVVEGSGGGKCKAQDSLLYKPDLSEKDDSDVFWKKDTSAFIAPAESVLTSLKKGSFGDAALQESPSRGAPSLGDGVSPRACLT